MAWDPLAKALLNSLKCPLCQSRIDLLDWKDKSDGRTYNFCCSSNWEHYRCFFVSWEVVPYVEYETVIVYNGKYRYTITQHVDQHSEIVTSEVDAENRVVDKRGGPGKIRFEQHLFDFSKTNREKLMNRLKTILVFS